VALRGGAVRHQYPQFLRISTTATSPARSSNLCARNSISTTARSALSAAPSFGYMPLSACHSGASRILLLSRVGVGVGEAACAPTATSWLGDLFPQTRRSRVLALFMLGVPVGGALGFFFSGPIAQAYGWRAAMVFAAVPALLLIRPGGSFLLGSNPLLWRGSSSLSSLLLDVCHSHVRVTRTIYFARRADALIHLSRRTISHGTREDRKD
jgi:MFS family permease